MGFQPGAGGGSGGAPGPATTLTLQQAIDLALQHHRGGNLPQAEQIYRQILAQDPNQPDAMHLLGVIAHQAGQRQPALELIQRAIAINPNIADYHSNLGDVLREVGRFEESVIACRRAIELDPNQAEAHNNLGSALLALNRVDEAIPEFRRAVALRPELGPGYRNLAMALMTARSLDEAMFQAQNALRFNALSAIDLTALGNALKDMGRIDDSIAAYSAATQVQPDYFIAWNNLSDSLVQKGAFDKALEACDKAIELAPQLPEAHLNKGNAYKGTGRVDEAMIAYKKSCELRPDYAEAYSNLGNIYKDAGRMAEAMVAYYKAVELKPGFAAIRSNWLYGMHFESDDQDSMIKGHREFDRIHCAPLSRGNRPHSNSRNKDRKIRIGYVSADFRFHPVGRAMGPLFINHDKSRFELYAYSDVLLPDPHTVRLQSYTDQWRSCAGMTDEQLAKQVEADQIDILVDLTLHMARNRLLAFAYKSAPIQMTYAGYPATTGLSAIDYRITDPYLDPPGETEAYNSEELLRLKASFWCYPTDEVEPPVNELPATEKGYVTFGSLNNPCKHSRRSIELWSKVLHAVPNSKMMLLVSERENFSEYFAGQFNDFGIDKDRLIMVSKRPRTEYLRMYNQIDLGLDPLPYHGHMTSCDSFWMGVPVVSLRGKNSVGRGGVSLLTNLGLTELIAESDEQFVAIATQWAADLPKLAELRKGLRQRMIDSPLCDAKSFVADLEQMYISAFEKWCDSPPPVQGGEPPAVASRE